MPELWIPSDELLRASSIALQKIENPFDPPDLASVGIDLGDIDDDDANEAAAIVVLASLSSDDDHGESGECSDDGDVDDESDRVEVDASV
ncbi:MAG TPA: hypothetical protein VGO80_19425 [Solirubrobacteraceae bacterium]|jgi:hypothetical protein|nr:hypothetical protein [Solirubrobacteraceae bacterium]